MRIKRRLRSILGDLLIQKSYSGNNYKARVLNKQSIKNFIIPETEAFFTDSNQPSIGGSIRILTSDIDNSNLIAQRLNENKEDLCIEAVKVVNKALECPRKADEGLIYSSSVVAKLSLGILLRSILSIGDKDYTKNLQEEILDRGENVTNDAQRIVIDFSSPNIAKPFHFGHLKSTLLGNYLANLNTFLGNQVIKLNYIGDWGNQYGLIDLGLEKFGGETSDKTPNDSFFSLRHLLNVYVRATKESYSDDLFCQEAKRRFQLMDKDVDSKMMRRWRTIRELSLSDLKQSYSALGIKFDEFDYESNYAKESTELAKRLCSMSFVEQKEDGVTVAKLEKNNKILEMPIVRSDGASLYITRDLSAAISRMNRFNFDQMLYVVGSNQEKHFHCLRELLKNIGYNWSDKLVHVKMGKVLGMSTRSGKVVLLSDIIEEATKRYIESTRNTPTSKVSDENEIENVGKQLALSALFVYDMRNVRTRNYDFDWDLVMLRSARSGINLQTTYARLCSLLEKSKENGIHPIELASDLDCNSVCCVEAINLMSYLCELDTALHSSYWSKDPSPLVDHALTLCKAINRARKSERLWVLGESDEKKARTRLTLFEKSKLQLEFIIRLMGMKPLNKV